MAKFFLRPYFSEVEETSADNWTPFIVAMAAMGILLLRYMWYYRPGSRTGKFVPKPIKPFYRQVLEAYFKYYQDLHEASKTRFEMRVQAFIDSNTFIARGFSHVSEEMKALVAGSAIQLTFGFEHINFDHFKKILIYPDDYYSKITRKYHQGEVNAGGIIVLSWKNFVSGYKDETDGRNLALHEMAHALRLENAIFNEEYDFIEPRVLRQFDQLAGIEMQRIKQGQDSFFRQYAAGNHHEFFAVAVENFFERPRMFYEALPELFSCMSRLLNQDPLQLMQKPVAS